MRMTLIVATAAVAIALSMTARSLREQQVAILDQLAEIQERLERFHGANRTTLDDLKGEFLGRDNAPLTMVEFSDLQCPFCREFHISVFDEINRDYITTGKLRYFVRHFPLETLHPLAIHAARATTCAGEQGKAWEMRHAILADNARLRSDSFGRIGHTLGLDAARFAACVSSPRADIEWQHDKAEGTAIGISGTPSFLVGRSRAAGFEGVRMSGVTSFAVFKTMFDELLAEAISGVTH